jgi:hypothetical protein
MSDHSLHRPSLASSYVRKDNASPFKTALASSKLNVCTRPELSLQADWEASPRWAGASGLFCQWTAIWRVAARLRTHHLRARPRRLFRCGSLSLSIILSSHWQTADKSRRLGRLSHRQSGPRMWSSTLQRSVRLGCRTALSKLRGMTSRPVLGRPTVARCPPAGNCACRRLCYCHFN